MDCGATNMEEQIHADHIKPISIFPELKLDLNNGQTLCRKCHAKRHDLKGI